MRYIVEKDLSEFKFWRGGKAHAELLTVKELDAVGEMLQEIFGKTPTEVEINDLFWFDFNEVLDLLGYDFDGDTGEIIREKEDDDEEDHDED